MLKFLRKYNKIILVVGGVILMIAFLVPQALQQAGGSPQKRTVASTSRGPISVSNLEDAARELQVVESILGGYPLVTGDPEDGGANRALHWLLLTREAEAQGFVGGPSSWSAAIDMHSVMMGQQMLIQQLQQGASQDQIRSIPEWAGELREMFLANRAGIAERVGSIDAVDDALAKFLGVQRMILAYRGAVRISDKAMRVLAEDRLNFADIDYAVLRAADVAGEVPDPTEEQLRAHFEAYRDVDPVDDEQRIGYRQRPRVQLEWLTIDRERVRQAVRVDPIEARKRWQTSRERFPGEFAEERGAIERELTNEAVNDAMRLADQVVRGRALQDTRSLREDGRYKVVPEDWRSTMSGIDAIAEDVEKALGERLGEGVDVEVSRRQQWIAVNDLFSLPRIGPGFVRTGAQSTVPFQQLIASSLELAGPELATGPQVGLIDGPVLDRAGNQHYFRMTEAQPAGPAQSLDEVRDEVITNVKRLAAFELLESRAAQIEAQLVEQGLRATAEDLGIDLSIARGRVSRERATAGQVASDEAVREQIARAAQELDPRRPVAEQAPELRYHAVPSERALAMVIAEIVGLDPLTQSEFDQAVRADSLRVPPPEGVDPFSYGALLERTGYVSKVRERDGEV